MVLFKISDSKARPINISRLKNEKELQDLVEKNLEEIFGLTLIETEFVVHPFRIDTVAFDKEDKAIVIIEYKESEEYSIIDQGYSYLNLPIFTQKSRPTLLNGTSLRTDSPGCSLSYLLTHSLNGSPTFLLSYSPSCPRIHLPIRFRIYLPTYLVSYFRTALGSHSPESPKEPPSRRYPLPKRKISVTD
jgi:hypothetical protein